MTSILFDKANFRSQLINQLLDGTLKIDPNVCHCIYRLKNDSKYDSFEVNVNKQYEPKICDYATTLYNLGYSLKYLGQGSNGLAGQICQDKDCQLTYSVKLIAYNLEYGKDVENVNRPENLEISLLKRLNQVILLPKISPHIILYLQDFRCDGLPVLWEIGKQQAFDDYLDKIFDGQYVKNRAQLLIVELASYGSLYSFIEKNIAKMTDKVLSIVYFQFVYTLAQIHAHLPGFRHNDLHLDNILVQRDEAYNPKSEQYYVYVYDGQFYLIPIISVQLKLWDFDMANIAGETNNVKGHQADAQEIGYRNNSNKYYDLHLFTNDLATAFFDLLEGSELLTMLERVMPPEYRGHISNDLNRGRLIPDIEYTTPHQLLISDPYILSHFAVKEKEIDWSKVVDVYGKKDHR